MISYGMTVLDEEDWDMSGSFQAGNNYWSTTTFSGIRQSAVPM